jgi:hypothetical protein
MSQLPLTLAADRMYAHEHNADGTTKHSRHCLGGFGRRDWRCYRCVELMRGAAPRGSWHEDYFAKKLGEVQRRLF